MTCLPIDRIYLYVEGELSPEENRSVKDHISFCEKCQKAVEERTRLIEASRSLPVWQTPKDFTQRVLAHLFPQRVSFRDWITAAAMGLFSAVLLFFAVYLISGQTLADLFINLNRTAISLFRKIVVVLVKGAKLISVGIQVIQKFVSLLMKGLTSLTTILGPELQIGLIVLFLVITGLVFYGAKRKFLAGEKA